MTTDVARRNNAANITPLDDHRPQRIYKPATDIFEIDDKVVLETEMPGVTSNAIDITLENRVLTIRGALNERSREGWRAVYAEYGEGDYERSFSVSDDIDQDNINASFKNGVLRLELPKAAAAKTRKIAVNAA